MEKKHYHHLKDGTFRNPEGSPKPDPNVKWSFKIFNREKKKLDMTVPKEHVVDLWYGISYDEIQRQKVPFVEPWRRNVYPLIEKRIYRGQCLEWMKKNNYPEPPRSACLCCPFHNNHEWLKIKNGPKKEWEDVVQFDKAIRKLGGDDGDLFLHRSCKPLGEIDFYTLSNSAQMSLLDECEGYCGV